MEDMRNIEKRNGFDNAWIVIGESSDSRTLPQIDWVKFSDLTFHICKDTNDSDMLAIGYMLHKNSREIKYEVVHDPETLKPVISDIWNLKAKTPIELFIELDLRGLVLFDRQQQKNGDAKNEVD